MLELFTGKVRVVMSEVNFSLGGWLFKFILENLLFEYYLDLDV